MKNNENLETLIQKHNDLYNKLTDETLSYLEHLNEEAVVKYADRLDGINIDNGNAESIQNAINEMKVIDEEASKEAEDEYNKLMNKDKKEIRAYVRKRFGDTNYFIELLNAFSDKSYKEKDAYFETRYLEDVFGRKGGLMTIYALEKKDPKKKSSTYRKYCEKIIRGYNSLGNLPAEGEDKTKYIKKYNAFIDESSKLASKYLNTKGAIKLYRLKKLGEGEHDFDENKIPRDYVMDVCKIAFMCLVAACSKNESRSKKAVKKFKDNRKALKNIIG